jgi:hypothetical protein
MTQATVPPQAGPAPAKTDPLAIWTLVLGIAGILCCPVIPSIIAIVLGGKSKEKIALSGGTLTGADMVRIGIILAWIGIALSVLGVIIGIVMVLVGGFTAFSF